jgi:hypothetical protein
MSAKKSFLKDQPICREFFQPLKTIINSSIQVVKKRILKTEKP